MRISFVLLTLLCVAGCENQKREKIWTVYPVSVELLRNETLKRLMKDYRMPVYANADVSTDFMKIAVKTWPDGEYAYMRGYHETLTGAPNRSAGSDWEYVGHIGWGSMPRSIFRKKKPKGDE